MSAKELSFEGGQAEQAEPGGAPAATPETRVVDVGGLASMLGRKARSLAEMSSDEVNEFLVFGIARPHAVFSHVREAKARMAGE